MTLAPLLTTALMAAAQPAAERKMAAYDEKVLAELAAVAPDAVNEARSAARAYHEQRWQDAFDGYQRVLEAAPRFHHALRRQCLARLSLRDRAGALPLCYKAVEISPVPANQIALATALTTNDAGERPRPGEVTTAVAAARQALDGDLEDQFTAQMACQIGLRVKNIELVKRAAERLSVLDPGSLASEFCNTFGAVFRGDSSDARRHLSAARAAGLPAEAATRLELFIDQSEPTWSRWGWRALTAIGIWGLLLGLLFYGGKALSEATLRSTRQMTTDRAVAADPHPSALRSIYRAVIWLTCALYYLSLPLLVLMLLGGAYVLWLAFAAIGRIPIKFATLVALMVLVSLWAVAKSLWATVVRGKTADPGPKLELAENSRFAAALREAADRVSTRPVDTVFLTPGTDAAVYEKGGMARRLSGRTERCLILGVGLLDGMTQGQLKAILAHEYGHFVNRDTAGGGLALAVRRSIFQMARSLAAGGAAAPYNPAWVFVTNFYKLFLRISQGASRLQEMLADRWAALAYGGSNFASGLRHTIARSVHFSKHAEATLREVVDAKLPLRNLYRYSPAQQANAAEVADEIEKTMSADPSPYDSHPRPVDRIIWVGKLPSTHLDASAELPVWDLFSNREALERSLTDVVRAKVAAQHGVEIADEVAAASGEEAPAAQG
jgi:Zn-dependent protease with chaperone function